MAALRDTTLKMLINICCTAPLMRKAICSFIVYFFVAASIGFASSDVVKKPTEIPFWHSMAGQLGTELNEIVDDFNHQHPDIRIKPIYKGDYLECLTSFAAAFQAKQPPAMVQVFEVGTLTMLQPKGVIKPVFEIMQEQKMTLPVQDFFPVIRQLYSQEDKLMAMPFNASIPVMFYNQEAIKTLGYTDAEFPKTWQALEGLARELRRSGYACAYTSSYPAWIFIESYASLHGLRLFDETNPQKAVYTQTRLMHHLERLHRWQALHFFEYGGRTDDATMLFTSARCPLYSQSSGGYNSIQTIVSFPIGMAPLPREANFPKRSNVVGGAAIWAVSGQTPDVYHGIAEFLVYLARPEVQNQWHQKTGYLPLGLTGRYASIAKMSTHPVLKIAKEELGETEADRLPKRAFPMHNPVRMINEEALEAIFSGIKSPEQALNQAVLRANHALGRFARNTQINDERSPKTRP